jgi:hypothetical protein
MTVSMASHHGREGYWIKFKFNYLNGELYQKYSDFIDSWQPFLRALENDITLSDGSDAENLVKSTESFLENVWAEMKLILERKDEVYVI